MFGFNKNSSALWLGDGGRGKLFTLKLKNVDASADPAQLWDHRYGGGRQIIEISTPKQRADRRLKQALDTHRGAVFEKDERGLLKEVLKVFNDVVIRVPLSVWNTEIQFGGNKFERLADNLSYFHKQDFGAELIAERPPAYTVIPDGSIGNDDEIMFQFGLGVFVPCENDRLTGRLSIRIKDKTPWHPLPDYIFYKNGKRRTRPAGLYENQQFFLIGPSTENAAVVTPETGGGKKVWFHHGSGGIWFNFADKEVRYGFGAPEYISNGEKEASGEIVFKDLTRMDDSDDAPELLMLKIEPAGDEEPVSGDEPSGSQKTGFSPSGSMIPDMDTAKPFSKSGTIIPGMFRHHLVLAGFALPKAGLIPDLESWTLWLDDSGQPVNESFPDATDESACTAFSDASAVGSLSWRKPGEQDFSAITQTPVTLKAGRGVNYELIPHPQPEMYHGILMLPDPHFFPLDEEPALLGREVPEKDFRLDQLSHPQSLKWHPGHEKPENRLGDFSLSGEEAAIELREDHLAVQIKGRAPIYMLDKEKKMKKTIHPHAVKEYRMEPGEFMVAGCYLLCFT